MLPMTHSFRIQTPLFSYTDVNTRRVEWNVCMYLHSLQLPGLSALSVLLLRTRAIANAFFTNGHIYCRIVS